MKLIYTLVCLFLLFSCIVQEPRYFDYTPQKQTVTMYKANYTISLVKVERPENAAKIYGNLIIDILQSDTKYKYFFEDSLVRVSWVMSSKDILFRLENKSEFSLTLPWDKAAFVDKEGTSHRVLHSGIKYPDKDKPQRPSVILKKQLIEDMVYPADYIKWTKGYSSNPGEWSKDSLLLDYDYHGLYLKGRYSTFDEFEKAVKVNVGKQIQVLLPLQMQDVTYDYIFIFKVDTVKSEEKEE